MTTFPKKNLDEVVPGDLLLISSRLSGSRIVCVDRLTKFHIIAKGPDSEVEVKLSKKNGDDIHNSMSWNHTTTKWISPEEAVVVRAGWKEKAERKELERNVASALTPAKIEKLSSVALRAILTHATP